MGLPAHPRSLVVLAAHVTTVLLEYCVGSNLSNREWRKPADQVLLSYKRTDEVKVYRCLSRELYRVVG